ncbi:MAG: SH3 domain-containing protein [Candidatus Promineofilum sp.]|nr:SH3 domain-containing protein [Promineifilum sp.]
MAGRWRDLACNAFAGAGHRCPAPPTRPAARPTVTCRAKRRPLPPGTLVVLVKLNVRTGPGVGYERVGSLLPDDTAIILGRDPASEWWRIVCPPDMAGGTCWVSGDSRYTRAESAGAVSTAVVPATLTVQPIEQP